MKSVKPGRCPSFLGGIGSVAAIIFGVFWTVMAAAAGAPAFLPIFGVIFILLGVVQAVYHFKNATGENRYSAFDITDGNEEPDPLHTYFKNNPQTGNSSAGSAATGNFCPYCGFRTESDHVFCKQCGKKI